LNQGTNRYLQPHHQEMESKILYTQQRA